jgi:hypothetical protein
MVKTVRTKCKTWFGVVPTASVFPWQPAQYLDACLFPMLCLREYPIYIPLYSIHFSSRGLCRNIRKLKKETFGPYLFNVPTNQF